MFFSRNWWINLNGLYILSWPFRLVNISFDGCLRCCLPWILQRWFGSLTWLGTTIWNQFAQFTITTRAQCQRYGEAGTDFWWKRLLPVGSSIFFTDGSKGRRVPVLVYIILLVPSPAFVIGNQVECLLRRPRRYLIVTDSSSFLKTLQTRKVASRTHSLVYKIKKTCWWLKNNEYEIHMMWIPSLVGVRGNERTDQLEGDALENGIEWHAPVWPSDFLPLSRVWLLEGWQSGWYTYFICLVVSFML
jgi:hypothetical protein